MTNGISINGNGAGVVINGIRCGLVSDVACDWLTGASDDEPIDGIMARQAKRLSATPEEWDIAMRSAQYLSKMRSKGYSKEDARKAFVQKIVDEAQRCTQPEASLRTAE